MSDPPIDTGQYGVEASSPGVPSVAVRTVAPPTVSVQTAGVPGPPGPRGPAGATGPAGPGVPTGGTTGQVLTKRSATNYDTDWENPSGGGAAGGDLTGTYPNPSIATGAVNSAKIADGSIQVADTATAFDLGAVATAHPTTTDVALNGHKLTGVADPANPQEGATKSYVDSKTGAATSGLSINAQTGTSYTLVLGDAGKFVTMTNGSASTLTVPPNSSVAFPVGTFVEGAQLGAGQLTLAPGSGVTLNATPGLKIAAQFGAFGLVKLATDTWLAFGRMSA